jgi:hypothetical protein
MDKHMSAAEYLSRKGKRKWNNQPTEYRGVKYASKKEAASAGKLDDLRDSGEIVSWTRQVPFSLPGGAKHYVDFLAFLPDGTFRLIEVKGRDLPMGKLKRRQVEELYQVRIEVW